MRIVSWNVNSVRRRLERAVEWVKKHEPDALCLQETKVVDEDFPAAEFEELGYRATVFGQKTYNGVAILSRSEPTDVVRGFADGAEEDPEARLIRATVGGVRIANAYVVNGKSVDSPFYERKLAWMERLRAALASQEDAGGDFVLLGDFNVAPKDIDTWDADYWRGKLLFSEPEHAALQAYLDWGLTDCLRVHHQDAGIYSWWDYRQLAFQKRRGLRIDLLLTSASLTAKSSDCRVDKDERRGKGASDHAPVVGDFDV